MALISFERSVETASFFSPLRGMEFAEQTIEVRRDPLTGMTAVASSELATKEEMFYGTTDWEHADGSAASSREGCFFCPEKVFEVTPRYPDEVLPGGRLRARPGARVSEPLPAGRAARRGDLPRDGTSCGPPTSRRACWHEGLGAAVEFAGRAEAAYDGLEHLELCCNHMLPAGASMVHPHFQVFGGPAAPWLLRLQWERAAAFRERHGVSYWQALVDEETARGERADRRRAPAAPGWPPTRPPAAARSSPCCPAGRASRRSTTSRSPSSRAACRRSSPGTSARACRRSTSRSAAGRSRGAAAAHAVVLRVVARSAFKPDYRTDDYFLQKQLGGELIFVAPEQIAATLRTEFSG